LLVELDKKRTRLKYCSAYGEVKVKELLAVVGGHGFLEISANQGNAAKRLNAKRETRVRIAPS
jgi:S-adenosylmethionine hydrolase